MNIEIIGTIFFACAVVHTFLVGQFQALGNRFADGSPAENFFHLLGEVEVVFGFWAGLFMVCYALDQGAPAALQYLDSRNFTEPAFVFVIMSVCSTRPILYCATLLIESIAKLIPLKKPIAVYVVTLIVGPVLGSFITEPAAMTVTALILYARFYEGGLSRELMYATLGVLFVNVSIGGTLTPYAAPPVIMVASKWQWDLSHMIHNFGWKGVLACAISTGIVAFRFRKELAKINVSPKRAKSMQIPTWIVAAHLLFLGLIVIAAHHMIIFVALFLFFIGLVAVSTEYQDRLELKGGLLVAFFLGGLVVLGGMQNWWIEVVIKSLNDGQLYLSAIALTTVIDNAALTYLGAQVEAISEAAKYLLVSGAVVGGGMTVIANAPNPAGYGILNPAFGEDGISPFGLAKGAFLPTVVAGLCFYFL